MTSLPARRAARDSARDTRSGLNPWAGLPSHQWNHNLAAKELGGHDTPIGMELLIEAAKRSSIAAHMVKQFTEQ
jgi:hypothetical protein